MDKLVSYTLSRQSFWHTPLMKLPERIRQARRKAKLSQTALASQIKVQRSAVSNWESTSNTFPTMVNLVAIARTCDVSLEWLGTGRGPMALAHDAQMDVQALDADLVDLPDERELLASYRAMPARSKTLWLELAKTLGKSSRKQR